MISIQALYDYKKDGMSKAVNLKKISIQALYDYKQDVSFADFTVYNISIQALYDYKPACAVSHLTDNIHFNSSIVRL